MLFLEIFGGFIILVIILNKLHLNSIKKEKKTGDVYNGKNIDTMSEMECQVYLKIALENEEFEIADKIKKQMGKYK